MDDAFEELDVSAGDQAVRISLGRLPRGHAPVVMSVGPVLHLDEAFDYYGLDADAVTLVRAAFATWPR